MMLRNGESIVPVVRNVFSRWKSMKMTNNIEITLIQCHHGAHSIHEPNSTPLSRYFSTNSERISLCRTFPAKWQKAVQQIPPAKFLPLQHGGDSDQGFAAWRGDKLLGAAAVGALQSLNLGRRIYNQSHNDTSQQQGQQDQKHNYRDRGSATKLMQIALSNRFLAAHVDALLPHEYISIARSLSDHGVGTMIEAAVAGVHEQEKQSQLSTKSSL
mmetsp:Transcript_51463/g.60147  ORF Transcript_51463/g.60147 Transcript_51463/m.60147 type:complete len:214 (-) Transcript_51463:3-644(-)